MDFEIASCDANFSKLYTKEKGEMGSRIES